MAGGMGTRIASINAEVPKPMITILDKPILEYQLESLKEQGFIEIFIVIGHLGNIIREYFGDGTEFGVHITYIIEESPLGTAGALYLLKEELKEDFILLNGDIIFDINFERFYQHHRSHDGVATLFTHPNSHPYDSGVLVTKGSYCVKQWLHKEDKREWYRNRVNAGIHIISPRIFEKSMGIFNKLEKKDLDRDVLQPLIERQQLFVYDSPEYVKDMGTPSRYTSIINDIKLGRVNAKNLSRKQKAIFLDRDGTINRYVGFLRNIEEFELLPYVAEAIRKINEQGYLAIVITNQPAIARGELTVQQLECIHNKMETLLGQKGAYIDAIYYCPHHPHSGYEGEVKELKIDCMCRKPKPGLLYIASVEFNIDLRSSWMIGDSSNDVEAGIRAGCSIMQLGEKNEYGSTLLEAVNYIFREL